MFFYITAASFLGCIVLGGATKGGHLSDALLELLTIPLLLVAVWRLFDAQKLPEIRRALAFCAALVAVPLLQLVPLPSALWTQLPGRESLVSAYALAGRPLAWAPISMASQSTWVSALALLPPLAVFLAVLTLDWRERRRLSLFVIALAVGNAIIGLLQIAEGATGPLRFFDHKEWGPVGFFANRNHLAALLYCGAILAAAWVVGGLVVLQSERRPAERKTTLVLTVAATLALFALVAVEAVVRSRAGVLLLILGLLGVVGFASARLAARPGDDIAVARRPAASGRWRRVAVGGATVALTAAALIFVGASNVGALLGRFAGDNLLEERPVFARVSFYAAKALMPLGAGLGSFVPAYQLFEKPKDLIISTYANHAHNDLLELALETGVIGPLLLGVFLIWLARRLRRAWTASDDRREAIDPSLIDAAIIIILLLLAHSLVDYPLRTAAIMATAAFACGLLIDPASARNDPRAPIRTPLDHGAIRERNGSRGRRQ